MLVRKTEERNHLEFLLVDGRIILKFILKVGCVCGLDSTGGLFRTCNETSGSIKDRTLEQPSDCQLVQKGSSNFL
jgi:hypothetical protein